MRRVGSIAIGCLVLGALGCDGGVAGEDAGVPPPEDAGGGPAPPMVVTSGGPVVGRTTGGVHAFYGIPYAAPPVGELRFRAPAPPPAWTEPRDASAPRAHCPQPPNTLIPPRGTEGEDCLDVDVFTPDLAPAAPLPVLVFVHGGAFVLGSSNVALWEGSSLASHGVVVVTVGYRLGLAGFLAHPALDAEAGGSSGMYGILDQRAALEWVRDNAAAFGGDPDRVMLFGESAGALSVCVHYVSPGSAGLFAAALSESGSCVSAGPALIAPADRDAARVRGVEIATELGCPGEDAAAAACLRALPVDVLVDAIRATSLPDAHPAYGALAIGPNVDGTVLPDAPAALLAAGAHAGVPYIAGTNADEGTLFSDDALVTTPADYEAQVRRLFGDEADLLLSVYPAADHASPLAAYDALLRDVMFVCPTRALARGLAADGVPARTYEVRQSNATVEAMGLGVAHAVELLYVFGNFELPFARASAAERNVQASVQGYWTRFAATGDPNGAGAPTWPLYEAATEPYLVIADPVSSGTALSRERCEALVP